MDTAIPCYTFEIQWPAPFASGWMRSSLRYIDLEECARAMASYMVISMENGTILQARLVDLMKETN